MTAIHQTVFAFAVLMLFASRQENHSCTIFVLADTKRVLFCNNEDWEDPNTKMWFVPAENGRFGAVYVGFDNGWAQGGMNTEGLAYDWVAGYSEKWERAPGQKPARGNSSQRMLETCRTVDEAVRFYEEHWEAEFSRARILVADKSGASAVIGALDGKLHAERASACRGFGYGRTVLNKRLAKPPKPTVANAMEILKATRQSGRYATKYANVFDLKKGAIHITTPNEKKAIELRLAAELGKGPHFYDMGNLRTEVKEPPKPLPLRMHPFPMDQAKAAFDPEPKLTAHLAGLFRQTAAGKVSADDYSPELFQEISQNLDQMREDLMALGEFVGLTFVERLGHGRERIYRYKVEFSKATVVQSFTIEDSKIITASESEMVEWKKE